MKKKILFLNHCPAIGGAGISGLNVLNAINKDQYDIVVYCTSTSNQMLDMFKGCGYNVIAGGNSPVIFSHFSGAEKFIFSRTAIINYVQIFKDRKKIIRIIEDLKPDIVIMNSMTLFWIGKIAKKFGAKTICIFQETYTNGIIGLRTAYIKHQLTKYTDSISFISAYDMNQNKKLNCMKRLIYNAVKEEDYANLNKSEAKRELNLQGNKYCILYVGGMSKLKGAHIIISAMRYLTVKNAVLIFVGYSWNGKKKKLSDCKNIKQKLKYILKMDYEAICIDYIIKHGLSGKISFYPHQRNIAKFYAACDILVFPATKPHQARPLIEAGYARIPAVVTNFPNYNEFRGNGYFYTFENGDYFHLAKIINEALNSDKNAAMVEENYKSTVSRHNERNYKMQIQNLIEDVL